MNSLVSRGVSLEESRMVLLTSRSQGYSSQYLHHPVQRRSLIPKGKGGKHRNYTFLPPLQFLKQRIDCPESIFPHCSRVAMIQLSLKHINPLLPNSD